MCESQIPCLLQTQPPESLSGGGALYWLNREKSARQTSPSFGGKARASALASHFIPAQGNASSTVQPRSLSASLFSVPSTWTAVFRPGNCQAHEPSRGPRGCVVKPTPLKGLTLGLERWNSGACAKPPLS